jgi:hypothetical protein
MDKTKGGGGKAGGKGGGKGGGGGKAHASGKGSGGQKGGHAGSGASHSPHAPGTNPSNNSKSSAGRKPAETPKPKSQSGAGPRPKEKAGTAKASGSVPTASGAKPAGKLTANQVNSLTDAICKAEGGAKAKSPCGVLSVKVKSEAEARHVVENTIRNNYDRWTKAGAKGDFVDFLADKYCPPSADPKGNKNWKRNVKKLWKK